MKEIGKIYTLLPESVDDLMEDEVAKLLNERLPKLIDDLKNAGWEVEEGATRPSIMKNGIFAGTIYTGEQIYVHNDKLIEFFLKYKL